jgi:hypothetical protein
VRYLTGAEHHRPIDRHGHSALASPSNQYHASLAQQLDPAAQKVDAALGNPSGDGLPRNGGWKVIKINGTFRYAKFARIAINWLAAEPDGDNVISEELQKLLGSDLLEFNRPRRVMITAENDSDCW